MNRAALLVDSICKSNSIINCHFSCVMPGWILSRC